MNKYGGINDMPNCDKRVYGLWFQMLRARSLPASFLELRSAQFLLAITRDTSVRGTESQRWTEVPTDG